jgi:hypothetical protein
MGNEEWTILRHGQHRTKNTEPKKNKNKKKISPPLKTKIKLLCDFHRPTASIGLLLEFVVYFHRK